MIGPRLHLLRPASQVKHALGEVLAGWGSRLKGHLNSDNCLHCSEPWEAGEIIVAEPMKRDNIPLIRSPHAWRQKPASASGVRSSGALSRQAVATFIRLLSSGKAAWTSL